MLGDLKEAIILVVFATMSVMITVVQETRTERVLEALRDLTSPRALVIRDGQRKRIAGRDVVRGDLIVLPRETGFRPTRCSLQSQDLQTDESTADWRIRARAQGRVGRSRLSPDAQRPGGDDLPHVFSGSLVVRGSGLAEVIAIGPRSEIGKIGQSLAEAGNRTAAAAGANPAVVRLFAVVGGAVSVLAVLLYGIMRGGWLDAVLAGIALGMSMLPGRVSGRPHRLHGDGRLANFAGARADAARSGHRNTGLRDGAVHRQDRHPDREPDDDRRTAR